MCGFWTKTACLFWIALSRGCNASFRKVQRARKEVIHGRIFQSQGKLYSIIHVAKAGNITSLNKASRACNSSVKMNSQRVFGQGLRSETETSILCTYTYRRLCISSYKTMIHFQRPTSATPSVLEFGSLLEDLVCTSHTLFRRSLAVCIGVASDSIVRLRVVDLTQGFKLSGLSCV